jgi:predicted RNA polymerase sigma factor
MLLYDGDNFENVALQNVPPAFARARENKPFRPHPRGPLSDLVRTKRVVTIDDLRRSPAYLEGNPTVIEPITSSKAGGLIGNRQRRF